MKYSTFGMMNGEEITNKHTMLSEIDAILHEGDGPIKPPDLELIYCEPYSVFFTSIASNVHTRIELDCWVG